MSENVQPKPTISSPLIRRMIIYAGAILVVFLLGFVPMWLKARSATNSLVEAERQITLPGWRIISAQQ